MRIKWTRESCERLVEIEAYIAIDHPGRAAVFIDELIHHVETTLPDNPHRGRIVPEISRLEIRELIYKKHRIVYRVRDDNIDILTVFEGHRLLRRDEIR